MEKYNHLINQKVIIMKNLLNTKYYENISLTYPLSCQVYEDLKQNGFRFISSNDFQKLFCEKKALNHSNIASFCESWNNLDTDNFMSDNGTYRKRKHATFNIKDRICNKNDYIPHYQTVDYNILNGGIERYFTEIDEIIDNPIFKELLSFAYNIFDRTNSRNWFVEAHQFRIESNDNMAGKPTPEGIHRDGVDFVLMALVKRQNMIGGVTTIYDLQKNQLSSFELDQFLDVALVNDHQVFHGVSEIIPFDSNNESLSFRDVLVITFKEIKQ